MISCPDIFFLQKNVCQYEQHDQPDYAAGNEFALVGYRLLRLDYRYLAERDGLFFDAPAEHEVEIQKREHKRNKRDLARVGEEITKAVAKRGADYDIRGIAAHGGASAEVRAEDLG